MRGDVAALQQAGGGKQDRPGAGRIEGAARPVAMPDPVQDLRVAPLHVVVGAEPQLGQDHDRGGRIVTDGEFRLDGNAVTAGERLQRPADDAGLDQAAAGRLADE